MRDVSEVVTKKAFAERTGVTAACVSQWISRRKISGDALVGRGCRARIRVEIARAQLKNGLEINQRLGANSKARLNAQKPPAQSATEGGEETIEDRIKAARLEQLALFNARAQEEAGQRSGRYVLADEARQSAGRIASRMVIMVDGALAEFANAIAAKSNVPPREILAALRSTWREVRARNAKAFGAEAETMAAIVGGDCDDL